MTTATEARRPTDTAMILLLGALMALGPLSIDAYLPSLPTIERELRGGVGSAELTVAAYFAGLASSQVAWGPLSDRFGRRAPLIAGLLLFSLGSLCCALSPTIGVLVAARALQGAGGSAGMVIVRAVVRDRWTTQAAARVLSQLMLVMGVAPVLAPILGTVVLNFAGWRVIFGILVGAGLLGTAAVARWLPDDSVRSASPASFSTLAAVVSDPRFVAFMLAGGFGSAGMFAYIASSPNLFQELHGLTPTQFALVFGLNATALIGLSQLNARLLRRWSTVTVALGGATALLAAGLVATLLAWKLPAAWSLELPLFAYVGSLGLVSSNTTAEAMAGQGPRAGLASGVLGSTQFAIAAAGAGLVGILPFPGAVPLGLTLFACGGLTLFGILAGSRAKTEPVLRSSGVP